MKRIIISDIHLNNWADDTNPLIMDFYDELLQIKERVELYINGDELEATQTDNKDGIITFWERFFKLKSKVSKKHKIIQILGNHDDYGLLNNISEKFKISQSFYLFININNIFIHHGHQFDPCFYTRSKIFDKMIERAIYYYGKIEKILNAKNIDDNILLDKLNNKIDSNARKFINTNRYEKLIYGHTHDAYVKEIDSVIEGETKVLANSGCWVNGHSDFLVIDNDEIKKYNYTKGLLKEIL